LLAGDVPAPVRAHPDLPVTCPRLCARMGVLTASGTTSNLVTMAFIPRRLIQRYRANRGPIGLALGGGGARGIAHVGVLQALEHYPFLAPRILAGTSAGSVMAVLYAAGIPVEEIRLFAAELDWFSHVVKFTDLLNVRDTSLAGLLPNSRLGEIVNERIEGRSFDELPRDVAVTATDLNHRRRIIFTSRRVAARMDRRELVRFLPPQQGHLPGADTVVISDVDDVGLAVRASCAVPGFFRPVQIKDMELVDGGLVDQTPVSVVRAMGARFSIGVSLALSFMPQKLASPRQALSGTVGMLGIPQLRKSLSLADIGFQVSGIEERSPIRAHQLDLIDIGFQDMLRELEDLFGRSRLRRRR
jgi:predicted acylesterase/phospholipase RssA